MESAGRRFALKVPPRGAPRVARTVAATAAALAAGIPTPAMVAHDVSGARLPPFWVQEWIDDAEDAERVWASLSGGEREVVARAYGETVAAMHATPYRDDPRELADVVAERFATVIANARANGELDDRRAARVASRVMELLPFLPRATCLVHGDLYLENVLVSRATGGWRFRALLDFEHARGSDAAEDFTKLGWWNFEPHPELRAPFHAGYGDPARHGASFERRRELFCLYTIVASLVFFKQRAREVDPDRPWMAEGDARQLDDARSRLARFAAEGLAC